MSHAALLLAAARLLDRVDDRLGRTPSLVQQLAWLTPRSSRGPRVGPSALIAAAALVGVVVSLDPWVARLVAQASPILHAQMTTATVAAHGFGGANPQDGGASNQSLNNGDYYTYTHRPGLGPGGSDAAELDFIPVNPPVTVGVDNPCTDKASCEGYSGWGQASLQGSDFADDTNLYVHWTFKAAAYNDPREAFDNDGFEGVSTAGGKAILLGDGSEGGELDTHRVIVNVESTGAGATLPRWNIQKNTDGAPSRITYNVADTGWHAYALWIDTSSVARANTAQTCSGSTITLDAGASAADDAYNNLLLITSGGTGADQWRTITDYVGATKVATLASALSPLCDATTTFRILNADALLKLMVDGDITTSTVTAQSSGTFVLAPDRLEDAIRYFGFMSWIYTGGTQTFQVSRLLIDDELDTTFYTDMGVAASTDRFRLPRGLKRRASAASPFPLFATLIPGSLR
jgi:hypothetical protein